MRTAATSARAKYMQYLEDERSKEKTETKQLKRKALEEEIDFLKQKKMFLQTDMQQTNEKANDLANEAEKSKDINLFIQSHELRKTISEKEIKINTLDVKLNEKGVGAGGGAAVLADITRTTSEEDRTPVLSVVIASRQLGLIIGPAFNIFLSEIDFHIFSLPVDKYTSPGLLMAMLWFLLEIMVLFAYYNLTSLKDDEDVEKLFQNYNSIITGSIPYSDLDNLSTLEVAFTNSYPPYSGGNPSTMDSLSPGALIYSASQPNLQVEWLEDSNDNLNSLKKEEIETINCQAIPVDLNKFVQHDKSPLKRVRNVETRTGSVSDRMIESAERLIQSTSGSYEKYLEENSSQEKQDNTNSRISSTNPSTPYSDPFTADEKSSLLGHIREDYFRDEIIVLLGLAFISCFAQTVLETIVTPVAQKYYSFDEMDNSYIYLFAGIEIIIVYTAIKYVSRTASDRSIIIFGLITLSVSMILPMLYIPSAVPGDVKTLAYFIVTIIVDLVGIAVITVCSSSLISKLTAEDSQALFQGFRRSMVSLGCIMGPLWGGAFLFNIYFLFSIPLIVIVLITVSLIQESPFLFF
ncbi:hypothetical protein AVEN_4906-1 [Araneus ventricosus]|uniref:Major facilitator superfamily (MFS) profile domain-containing protein n=1 Tax=Araneus ventricosus TaxID=182803 RepID=A0A4Y2NTW8_ARAVE|nr:hypothetical protein AVEN_4906-1 [Araneus ventricosus]